jgi:anti-sigma factor RsiW
MGHDDIHDLTAAYALDALDEQDRAAFEEHLAGCERCREEVVTLQEAAATLAYAVDAPAPPPELRGRILARARAERPNVLPLRPRWAAPAAVIAAVAAAVAVGVGIWAATLSHDLSRERSAAAAQRQALARAAV